MNHKIFSHKYVLFALLIIAGLVLYWDVIQYQFVLYDDPLFLNALVSNVHGLWPTIKWSFTSIVNVNWSPVTVLSLAADYGMYGLNPAGYHATNLIIHCVNAVLLFVLLEKLLNNRVYAYIIAILFLIHPLNAETVSWVSERKGLLGAFFSFISIIAYIRYITEGQGKISYVVSALALIAALLSKAVFVVLPLLFVMIDWYMRKGSEKFNFKNSLVQTTPFFLISLIVGLLTIYVHSHSGGIIPSRYNPLSTRLENALNSYVVYLEQMLYPVHLIAQYRMVEIPWHRTVINLGIVLSIFTLVARYAATRRYLALGLLWYTLSILPVIGILQSGFHAHADRYTYFPLIGMFIILVILIHELVIRLEIKLIIRRVLLFSVLAILGLASWIQHQTWRDTLTLFTHMLNVDNKNYVAYTNLARFYIQKGNIEKGLENYRAVVKIAPFYVNMYDTIAFDLLRAGKPDVAVSVLDDLIHFNSRYANAYIEKAEIRINQRRYKEALKTLQQIGSMGLKHPDTTYLLAFTYHQMGEDDRARDYLQHMPAKLRSRDKVQRLVRELDHSVLPN